MWREEKYAQKHMQKAFTETSKSFEMNVPFTLPRSKASWVTGKSSSVARQSPSGKKNVSITTKWMLTNANTYRRLPTEECEPTYTAKITYLKQIYYLTAQKPHCSQQLLGAVIVDLHSLVQKLTGSLRCCFHHCCIIMDTQMSIYSAKSTFLCAWNT